MTDIRLIDRDQLWNLLDEEYHCYAERAQQMALNVAEHETTEGLLLEIFALNRSAMVAGMIRDQVSSYFKHSPRPGDELHEH